MGNPTIDPTKKAIRSNQEPSRQEREKMQKPPQIIVIPQSMLAGQKSLLRLAPSPMNRNSSALLSTSSPSPLLSGGGGGRGRLLGGQPKVQETNWETGALGAVRQVRAVVPPLLHRAQAAQHQGGRGLLLQELQTTGRKGWQVRKR